jgi:hypothetical protein
VGSSGLEGALIGPAEHSVKWLADENLRNSIIRGILRRQTIFDIVRAQDIPEVGGRDDLALLGYATNEGRIVVTHDVTTMVPAMREQVRLNLRCAPIVFIPESLPTALAIDQLLLLDECAEEADWAGGVLYLPLR